MIQKLMEEVKIVVEAYPFAWYPSTVVAYSAAPW